MYWDASTNTAHACQLIEQYKHLDLIVFPELSVTGFHRGVADKTNLQQVDGAINTIRELCQQHSVSVMVGAPIMRGEKVFNSYVLIDACGRLTRQWDKVGLTPSEARFFTRGEHRQPVGLNNKTVSTIMCREVDDLDWFLAESAQHNIDLVIWPSYIGDRDVPGSEGPNYYNNAATLAQRLKSVVIQCNWPEALNEGPGADMYGSAVIGANGDTWFTLPANQPCFGVVDLSKQECNVLPLSKLEASASQEDKRCISI
jgi:predicted amidohydrolase